MPDALVAVRLVYVAAYAAIAVIDLRERRIPNAITYPLLVLALVARPAELRLAPLENVIAALVAFALFAAMAFRGWMGMGDAKLAAVIALASGPALALTALWLAFLLGAIVAVLLIVLRRAGRGTAVAFGPYLAAAGAIAALVPDELVRRSPFAALFG